MLARNLPDAVLLHGVAHAVLGDFPHAVANLANREGYIEAIVQALGHLRAILTRLDARKGPPPSTKRATGSSIVVSGGSGTSQASLCSS